MEKLHLLPYSSNLIHSDYHLLGKLQNHLDGFSLTSKEEVEHELVSYFASVQKNFTSMASTSLLTDRMRFLEESKDLIIILIIRSFYMA